LYLFYVLLAYVFYLAVVFGEAVLVEVGDLYIVLGDKHGGVLLIAETIHDEVVCYTYNPTEEKSVAGVLVLLYGRYHLQEGILKDIVGYFFVLHLAKYVGEDSVLIFV
jgi:hypothetical protein